MSTPKMVETDHLGENIVSEGKRASDEAVSVGYQDQEEMIESSSISLDVRDIRTDKRRREAIACGSSSCDDLLYSFIRRCCGKKERVCGNPMWETTSLLVILGKWGILATLDLSMIVLAALLVVRSSATATDDMKESVYSTIAIGFCFQMMEIPLIILLMRFVGLFFFPKNARGASASRLCRSCCLSKEALRWMMYGRQAFWFFEILAASSLRCSVDEFLITIPETNFSEYDDDLETCDALEANVTDAIDNSTDITEWLANETARLPEILYEYWNASNTTNFTSCNCSLTLAVDCEPSSPFIPFPDMAGCAYFGLRYESFEQAESIGLAFLIVYAVQFFVRLIFMGLFPGFCCGRRDDSALAHAAAELETHAFERAMDESMTLREAVSRNDVVAIRDFCEKHNVAFVDTAFPPAPSSIESVQCHIHARSRLRASHLALRRILFGTSRWKYWVTSCLGRCLCGVLIRFFLPLYPYRLYERVMQFDTDDPVWARAKELHGGHHGVRLFMKQNRRVMARRESAIIRRQGDNDAVGRLVFRPPPVSQKAPVAAAGVSQGHRGDCWFVAAIAAVAQLRPDVIVRLFSLETDRTTDGPTRPTSPSAYQRYNRTGVYGVWLYWDGQWRHQLVDDWLPCVPVFDFLDGQRRYAPLGAKVLLDNEKETRNDADLELWVALLEKAAAKCAGSYKALDGGGLFEALTVLTGSPCSVLDRDTIPPNDMWNSMLEMRRRGCVMVASPSKQAPDLGITRAHLYGIIDVHRLKRNGARLVRIQNPWGFSKFQGPYATYSFVWDTSLREELKANETTSSSSSSSTKMVRIELKRDKKGKMGLSFGANNVVTLVSERAAKQGVKRGDKVLRLNGVDVKTFEDTKEVLRSLEKNETLILEVDRSSDGSTAALHPHALAHGSFWMYFSDFIMSFEKVCVADVQPPSSTTAPPRTSPLRLLKRLSGTHRSRPYARVRSCSESRKRPHRFGFGLWGQDHGLEFDGSHVTTCYDMSFSSSNDDEVSVTIQLNHKNPRRLNEGTTVMGPVMAAMNTCFVAVFERAKEDIVQNTSDQDVPHPWRTPSDLLHRFEASMDPSSSSHDTRHRHLRLVGFAQDKDGYNVSVRDVRVRTSGTYVVLVGSLPHESSIRTNDKDESNNTYACPSDLKSRRFRVDVYGRLTSDKGSSSSLPALSMSKRRWELLPALHMSASLLAGSFSDAFAYVPPWSKVGWIDRSPLRVPIGVNIQRVAFRLIRLQVSRLSLVDAHVVSSVEEVEKDSSRASKTSSSNEIELMPSTAQIVGGFRPLLCLTIRTVNATANRSDSRTKALGLAALVEMISSTWAARDRSVPDVPSDDARVKQLSQLDEAGWRVMAPRFYAKLILPLREAIANATELEPKDPKEKPFLRSWLSCADLWINLCFLECFWQSLPPVPSDGALCSARTLWQRANVLEGVHKILLKHVLNYITVMVDDVIARPGLGCTVDTLRHEMIHMDRKDDHSLQRITSMIRALDTNATNATQSWGAVTRFHTTECIVRNLGARENVLELIRRAKNKA